MYGDCKPQVLLLPTDEELARDGILHFWGATWMARGDDTRLPHCSRSAFELFTEIEALDLIVSGVLVSDLDDRVEIMCRDKESGVKATLSVLKCLRCDGLSHPDGPALVEVPEKDRHGRPLFGLNMKPGFRRPVIPDAGSHSLDCPFEVVKGVLRA